MKTSVIQPFCNSNNFWKALEFKLDQVNCTQIALLSMVEQMLLARDKNGAALDGMSKVLDWINQDILVAKLHVCKFERNALRFIHDYLSGRPQKAKVGFSFSNF